MIPFNVKKINCVVQEVLCVYPESAGRGHKKINKLKKSCNYPDNSTIRGPECDTRGKQECTQPAAHIVLVDTKRILI